jgi:hypothetical protein
MAPTLERQASQELGGKNALVCVLPRCDVNASNRGSIFG